MVGIDLERCPATNADVEQIVRAFPRLVRLKVDGAEINDQALPHVAKLKDLTDLSLMNTDIHDDAVKELQALPKLKSLGLRRCSFLTDAALDISKPARTCRSWRFCTTISTTTAWPRSRK